MRKAWIEGLPTQFETGKFQKREYFYLYMLTDKKRPSVSQRTLGAMSLPDLMKQVQRIVKGRFVNRDLEFYISSRTRVILCSSSYHNTWELEDDGTPSQKEPVWDDDDTKILYGFAISWGRPAKFPGS